eukprot:TRINITY_DN328_c0_g1_i1.p1 TRINITY_DN328_c0_g1~~TRINITY_DN328_c0_g1_i1.p1  ORF type:complete len:839 (+),score=267.59 TRINITY_DN328_c0_g1_i1:46-2517(+)
MEGVADERRLSPATRDQAELLRLFTAALRQVDRIPSPPTDGQQQKVSHIFWDVANCPLPPGYAPEHAVDGLRRHVKRVFELKQEPLLRGRFYLCTRRRECGAPPVPMHQLEDLTDLGFTHVDPGAKRGADDMKMKDDLSDLLLDTSVDPSRCVVCLVSGDRDFSGQLRALKEQGYGTLLVHNWQARRSFRSLAEHTVQWQDLLDESLMAARGMSWAPQEGWGSGAEGRRTTFRSVGGGGGQDDVPVLQDDVPVLRGDSSGDSEPSPHVGASPVLRDGPALTGDSDDVPVLHDDVPAPRGDSEDTPVLHDGPALTGESDDVPVLHDDVPAPRGDSDGDADDVPILHEDEPAPDGDSSTDEGELLSGDGTDDEDAFAKLTSWLACPLTHDPYSEDAWIEADRAARAVVQPMIEELPVEAAQAAAVVAARSSDLPLGAAHLHVLQYQSMLESVLFPLIRSAAWMADRDNAAAIHRRVRAILAAHGKTVRKLREAPAEQAVGLIVPWESEQRGRMARAVADFGDTLVECGGHRLVCGRGASRESGEQLMRAVHGSGEVVYAAISASFSRLFNAACTLCTRVPTERMVRKCASAIADGLQFADTARTLINLEKSMTRLLERMPSQAEPARAFARLHAALAYKFNGGAVGTRLLREHLLRAARRAETGKTPPEVHGALDAALHLCQPVGENGDFTAEGRSVLDDAMPRLEAALAGGRAPVKWLYNFAVLQHRRTQHWVDPAVAEQRLEDVERMDHLPYVRAIREVVMHPADEGWPQIVRLVECCTLQPWAGQSDAFLLGLKRRQAAQLARDLVSVGAGGVSASAGRVVP